MSGPQPHKWQHCFISLDGFGGIRRRVVLCYVAEHTITMPGSYWVRLMPERPDAADQIVVTDGRRVHLLFSNCNLYAREFGETFPRAVFSERIDPPPFVVIDGIEKERRHDDL